MSDIKLIRTSGEKIIEIKGQGASLERSLQVQLERNLDAFLGVRFLASEYSTGNVHCGRIDTLGIDEDGSPVIIEYKRAINVNVINQGLFYLDWLFDHKAEFELLVLKKLGQDAADKIDWSGPRLLCIAGDFTRYDVHAVQQINRYIELIRYRRYSEELLLLEQVNAASAETIQNEQIINQSGTKGKTSIKVGIVDVPPNLVDLYTALDSMVMAFGDDVILKKLKLYWAYRRLKNFISLEFRPNLGHLLLHVKVDPSTIQLEEGFTKDVRQLGHWGTGDLESVIKSMSDLEKARPLLMQSYENS